MNRKMSARVFVDVGQNGNVGVEQNGNVDVEVGVDKTGSPFSVRRLSTYMFEADPANANQEELTRSSKYQSGDMDLNMDADAESTCMQNSNGVKFPPRSPLGNNSNDEIPITHARNDVVRRHVNTHIEKHSDNYMAPRMSVIEMLFEDADFIKFKRTNITFDTCSSIPLLIFQAFVFVTRASLAETFFLSPYFSAALVMSIGTIFLFSVLMVVLFAERYTNPNYISAKMSNSKSANNSSNIRRSGSIKFDFAAQKKQVEIQAYNDFYKRIIQTPVFQETFEFLAIIGSISIGESCTFVYLCPSAITFIYFREMRSIVGNLMFLQPHLPTLLLLYYRSVSVRPC